MRLEARTGIEPVYAALQAAASPLCHLADAAEPTRESAGGQFTTSRGAPRSRSSSVELVDGPEARSGDIGLRHQAAIGNLIKRHAVDEAPAIARLTQAGVLPVTVESVLLEMVHEAGTERFKQVLGVIK